MLRLIAYGVNRYIYKERYVSIDEGHKGKGGCSKEEVFPREIGKEITARSGVKTVESHM